MTGCGQGIGQTTLRCCTVFSLVFAIAAAVMAFISPVLYNKILNKVTNAVKNSFMKWYLISLLFHYEGIVSATWYEAV